MLTILLEVKRNDGIMYNQFYNPAAEGFKKYPRTQEGIQKAIRELTAIAIKNKEWITEYRFKVYDGKYEYWKEDMQPMFTVDNMGNILQ